MSDRITDEKLAQLRESSDYFSGLCDGTREYSFYEQARLMTAIRTDTPRLLDEVDRLREENKSLSIAVDHGQEACDATFEDLQSDISRLQADISQKSRRIETLEAFAQTVLAKITDVDLRETMSFFRSDRLPIFLESLRLDAMEVGATVEEATDSPHRDANGEVLEVGDIVVPEVEWLHEYIYIVEEIHKGDDLTPYSVIARQVNGAGQARRSLGEGAWQKLTTLTADQYLPLARRTLDPEMTRRERRGMLTRGVCGEYGEFDDDPSVEEVGDLLWYASILADEIGKDADDMRWIEVEGRLPTWLTMDGNCRDECIKKAIYHDVGTECLKELAAEGLYVCHLAAERACVDLGEIRYRNIRKLVERYPDGFVLGGGKR